MFHLIVAEGGREYILCSGRREDLEALARQLRAEKLFRYVRVDTRAPPEARPHAPPPGPAEGRPAPVPPRAVPPLDRPPATEDCGPGAPPCAGPCLVEEDVRPTRGCLAAAMREAPER